jgi:hypothetical protein
MNDPPSSLLKGIIELRTYLSVSENGLKSTVFFENETQEMEKAQHTSRYA